MQITGAIFDLDGTLVDSMWMWRRSFGDVLEDLHINMTPDFLKGSRPFRFTMVA